MRERFKPEPDLGGFAEKSEKKFGSESGLKERKKSELLNLFDRLLSQPGFKLEHDTDLSNPYWNSIAKLNEKVKGYRDKVYSTMPESLNEEEVRKQITEFRQELERIWDKSKQ